MNYLRAGINWGHVAVRAVGYGTVSLTAGKFNHRISQWAMRHWCAGSSNGLRINRQLFNGEVLDEVEQCVFIANHLSVLDILVLGSFLEHDYRWLAKAPLFSVPFMGWHLAAAGHIPVYRGAEREKNASISERVHAVVEQGASLLFFPEGTRSDTGVLRPFKIGAFMTAVAEELPVVPLVLRGTHELMVKGARDLSVHPDRTCSVTVLPPIVVPEKAAGGRRGAQPPSDEQRRRARRMRQLAYEAFSRELHPDRDVLPGEEAAEERDLSNVRGI